MVVVIFFTYPFYEDSMPNVIMCCEWDKESIGIIYILSSIVTWMSLSNFGLSVDTVASAMYVFMRLCQYIPKVVLATTNVSVNL